MTIETRDINSPYKNTVYGKNSITWYYDTNNKYCFSDLIWMLNLLMFFLWFNSFLGDENFYDQNAFVTERNTLGSEYDTMADIRANTEGIYDETRTTPSKPLTEDVYDISFKARMNQENTYDVTSPSNNQNNSEIYDTSVIV